MDQIFPRPFRASLFIWDWRWHLRCWQDCCARRAWGWRGERAAQAAIRRQPDPLIYVDMHNVTLPTADGGTQIDHLIFSPYGLFVLETKNYQGWIFGNRKQREWTQQIFRKRSRFQNPLRQNYKAISRPCGRCWTLRPSICTR